MTVPLLELKKVSKKYFVPGIGDFWANRGVDLSVGRGEIHALVGENGAGKSTLMKIVYGMECPDEGELSLNGNPVRWASPQDAIQNGIGMVHQHFMLSGPHTALQNAILGVEPLGKFGFLDLNKARQDLEYLANTYHLPVDWDQTVETLPLGTQQRVEILKILYRHASILILDEPTAVLTPQEVTAFFENLKILKAEGKTIILITHKLKEVMAISDRVTVLRAGEVVGRFDTSKTSADELAFAMVGRKIHHLSAEPDSTPHERNLVFKNDEIEIRSGEILGVAGVDGNGQRELIATILKQLEQQGSNAFESVALIPEDRHAMGLCLDWTLEENFLIGQSHSGEFQKFNFIRRIEVQKAVSKSLETFDVRPRSGRAIARGLSGGNQQKWVIAREMYRKPKLIIVSQPTRGVDIGAIEQIHRTLLEAKAAGAAILLVSSELDELLALSDRMIVLYRGQIVDRLSRQDFDEARLGCSMAGAK